MNYILLMTKTTETFLVHKVFSLHKQHINFKNGIFYLDVFSSISEIKCPLNIVDI